MKIKDCYEFIEILNKIGWFEGRDKIVKTLEHEIFFNRSKVETREQRRKEGVYK